MGGKTRRKTGFGGSNRQGQKEGDILRIKFQDHSKETLEEISCDRFFDIFEKNKLLFLYQEKTMDGGESRFFLNLRTGKPSPPSPNLS